MMKDKVFFCFRSSVCGKAWMKRVIFLLLFVFLSQIMMPMPSPVAQASSGSKSSPYGDHVQISYRVTGATLGNSSDGHYTGGNNDWYRMYTGKLGTGTLTVSGTASTKTNRPSTLEVEVGTRGDSWEEQSDKYSTSFGPGTQVNFEVSVPIPPVETGRRAWGSFQIKVTAEHDLADAGGGTGTRYTSVTVWGDLTRTHQPAPAPDPDNDKPSSDPSEPRIIITNCPGRLEVGERITIHMEVKNRPPGGQTVMIHPKLQIIEGAEFIELRGDDQVVGLKPGSARLGAYVGTGAGWDLHDTCVIEVYDTPVRGITLEPASITLDPKVIEDKGQKRTRVTAIIDPPDAKNKKVHWSSSNPQLVKVDPSGDGTQATITAFSPSPENVPGLDVRQPRDIEVEVTATTDCGGHTAALQVRVSFVPVRYIWLETAAGGRDAVNEVYMGDQVSIRATVFPKSATDKRLNWTSTNPGIGHVITRGYPADSAAFRASHREHGYTYIIASSTSNPEIGERVMIRTLLDENWRSTQPMPPRETTHPLLSEADSRIVDQLCPELQLKRELWDSELELGTSIVEKGLDMFWWPKAFINAAREFYNYNFFNGIKELIFGLPVLGRMGVLADSIITYLTGDKDWAQNMMDFPNPEPEYYMVPISCCETGGFLLDPDTGEPVLEKITRDENLRRKRGLSPGHYQ